MGTCQPIQRIKRSNILEEHNDYKKYKSIATTLYSSGFGVKPNSLDLRDERMRKLLTPAEVLECAKSSSLPFYSYITCGLGMLNKSHPIEIFICSKDQRTSVGHLLGIVADFHLSLASGLSHGHTVNFGIPWVRGSKCTYGLISNPYPIDPQYSEVRMDDLLSRIYWVMPITKQELDFKKKYGLDAFEDRFESSGFDYSDPMRASVV